MKVSRTTIATVAAAGMLAATAPAAHAFPSTDSLMPPPEDCEVDVEQVADETPGPFPDVGWTVGEHDNLCGNLGYLFLETEGGTVSSPTQVVLFNRGEQVATQPAGDARTLLGNSSDFHVELRVQQEPAPGQANADAEYQSEFWVWNPFESDATRIEVPALPGS